MVLAGTCDSPAAAAAATRHRSWPVFVLVVVVVREDIKKTEKSEKTEKTEKAVKRERGE